MSQLFSIRLEKSGETASTNHFKKKKKEHLKIWRRNMGIQHRDKPETDRHLLIPSLKNPLNLATHEVS